MLLKSTIAIMNIVQVYGLRHTQQQRSAGFTAVELMVVVSIVAILAALAAPSFKSLIERWRVRDVAEAMESSYYAARSEAIKRGGNIVIQRRASAGQCTAGTNDDWSCGWEVGIDADGNGAIDANGVLSTLDVPRNIVVTRSTGGVSISLDEWGRITGTLVGFSVIPTNKSISDPSARGVCISRGGRVRKVTSEDYPCT